MPSIPPTVHYSPSIIRSSLDRRATSDSLLQAQSRAAPETSTVIAIIFGFAAIMIIATSACIILSHRRKHQPSQSSMPGWRRVLGDPANQPSYSDLAMKELPKTAESKPVPMLEPMAFLQGREGPKEWVGASAKRRRSSSLPRLIADGMGGLWPRRHSTYTLSSNHPGGQDGEEQEEIISRSPSRKSHRSRRGSKATMTRKNGSHISTSSARLATTVQMERPLSKKPSVTFAEPSVSLSASPSAFPASRLSRNTTASTTGAPSSYKPVKSRAHRRGDSFLEDDIRDDEVQAPYVGSVASIASSSRMHPINERTLAAFPVPPLPVYDYQRHTSKH